VSGVDVCCCVRGRKGIKICVFIHEVKIIVKEDESFRLMMRIS
jgi:hypothetical protein